MFHICSVNPVDKLSFF
jgi:hypothetical protein